MSKIDELIVECDNRSCIVEVGYCRINGINVCIRQLNRTTIYEIVHQKTAKKAIKKALKWVRDD